MEKFLPIKKTLQYDKLVISIRIEESKLNKIDELASSIDISRNELINQCIEYALNNLELNKSKKEENITEDEK